MKRTIDVYVMDASHFVGRIVFDDSRPNASQFAYHEDWLNSPQAFELSPDLPLGYGWAYLSNQDRQSPFPLAIADTEPDAWGRTVIRRAFRKSSVALKKKLSELDYLLGVDDFSRIGAIRLTEGGSLSFDAQEDRRRTPTLLDLSKIYDASRRLELNEETIDDLRYLEGKGTSLGGARPKCSVLNADGHLALGKFPSAADQRSVAKGEILGLELAKAAGIRAASGRVHSIDGVDFAVIDRFDRAAGDDVRIPYMSLSSFMQHADRAYPPPTYLDFFERLSLDSADSWEANAEEMLRRLFLNILISNTDDHGRNTGLLLSNRGTWELSPAFDINPEPRWRRDSPYCSKLFLDDGGPIESVRQIWEARDDFGLSKANAAKILQEVVQSVKSWRTIAAGPAVRMTPNDLKAFAPAFEHVHLEEAERILSAC